MKYVKRRIPNNKGRKYMNKLTFFRSHLYLIKVKSLLNLPVQICFFLQIFKNI